MTIKEEELGRGSGGRGRRGKLGGRGRKVGMKRDGKKEGERDAWVGEYRTM